jgi:glycosyltransferase involved in cell wall biosynthesis
MRIVHVIPSYLPATRYGGPVFDTHALCSALAQLGHTVQVLTTDIDGPTNTAVPLGRPVMLDGVEVHYFHVQHLRRLTWSSDMALGMWRLLPGASLVHLHSVFLAPTSIAAWIARRSHVPYMLAPHGALVPELIRKQSRLAKTAWLTLLERRNLLGASYLHAMSEAEYGDAARLHLPLPPACIVPNGVDVPDFSALPAPSCEIEAVTRKPYVLFLGRLSWKKGLDRLLASLEGTRVRLLIAGPDEAGYQRVLHDLMRARGLGGQVEFLGAVHGADKWWLLRNARCLALPSYNESFGNVVAEAMAAATPVVVTPEVAIQVHVRRAQAGLVVEGAAEPLRRALQAFWSDTARRDRMGEAARRYATEHLSWAGAARQMVGYYREIAREQDAPSPRVRDYASRASRPD